MRKILILFLMLSTFYSKCQVHQQTKVYTFQIINDLNEPLSKAIERHIEVSKAYKIKRNDDFFILVSVFPTITKWQIPNVVFDSMYAVNDFKTVFPKDSVTPIYNISIILASKKYYTHGWQGFGRKNKYFTKYKKYEVLLSSDLNLIFNSDDETKQITLQLFYNEDAEMKKHYRVYTSYWLWNRYVAEIRIKDLIWPAWTGARDEFK